MKQTNLKSLQWSDPPGALCSGRLFVIWGLYGAALATLWQLAGPTTLGHAAVWVVALVAGLVFLIATREV